MRIVRILGPNPIEDEVQTIGEIRNASPEAVEIEAIFDVGAFNLAKHFVALETAEPLYPRLIVPGIRRVLIIRHDQTVLMNDLTPSKARGKIYSRLSN